MRIFANCPAPQHVLMAIWAYREWLVLITKNVSKKKKKRKKRGVNESSHSVLCWYKWRQCFWSHLGVCNSQMEDCLSWCLTVQTQVCTTKKRESKYHQTAHKKEASYSYWCLWTHSYLIKIHVWTQLASMQLRYVKWK